MHVKRFRWCNNYRTKVDVPLVFPVRALDMSSYLLDKMPETRRSAAGGQLYDLAAVIVHHGSGAGSGHYTAFASNAGERAGGGQCGLQGVADTSRWYEKI